MAHGTFELTFYPAPGATEYPVTALYRPDESREVAVHRAGGVFRYTPELHRELVDAELSTQDYGTALGRAVFQDAVRELFGHALRDTPTGEPLHVLLALEAEPLRALRWERLLGPFAPGDADWDFLALNQKTALAVYVAGATQQKFPPVGLGAIRVLLVVASPAGPDTPAFGVADAVAAVTGRLGDRVTVLARDVPAAVGLPTLEHLSGQLNSGRFTVLHVVAHGTFASGANDFCLVLEKSDGTPDRVPGQTLITALRRLPSGRAPYLTFLAACESAVPGLAAHNHFADRLARALGLPAVLGMADPVSAKTAADVATGFYTCLLQEGRPDVALVAARVGLSRSADVLVPVLVSQLGGRPLFDADIDTPPPDGTAVARGLDRLGAELERRAPAVLDDVKKYRVAPPVPGAAGWDEALAELNNWADEAVGVSFNGLCAGVAVPPYRAAWKENDKYAGPFNGMTAFGFEQRQYFKAREDLVEDLAARLGAARALAVVGPSGSGKSSVVFAGLFPHLKLTADAFASFAPGPDPHKALADALAAKPAAEFLVVDQFEELFTHHQPDAVRAAFIDKLRAEQARRKVVVTLRSEFRGKLAGTWLGPLVGDPSRDIAPMPPGDLRRAMEEQAAEVGLRFEEGLKSRVIHDVGDEPGRMPLIQLTLLKLWEGRRGLWLKTAEYDKLGGVRSVVASTADGYVRGLPPAALDRAVDIILRLTRVADDADLTNQTRRRVRIVDLVPAGEDEEPTRSLLQELVDKYLVITSGADAEVAHEALLRHWGTLGEWVGAHRGNLLIRQSVAVEARSWDAGGRKPDGLMRRGAKLAEAAPLRVDAVLRLNATEAAYLDACRAAEAQQRTDHARQERFREWAWRAAVAGCVLLFVLLAYVAVAAQKVANAKSNLAQEQGDRADLAVKAASDAEKAARAIDAAMKQLQSAHKETRRADYADKLKMALTYRALHPVRMEQALDSLTRHGPGDDDLRGFEWYHLKYSTAQARRTIATPAGGFAAWLPKPGQLLISDAAGVWHLPAAAAVNPKVEDWRRLDAPGPLAVAAAADAPVVAVVNNRNRVLRFDLSGDAAKALPAYPIPADFLSSSVAAVPLDCVAISADGTRVAVASLVPDRDVGLNPKVQIAVLGAAGAAYSKTAVPGEHNVTGMAFTPAGELAVVNSRAELFTLAVAGPDLKLRKRVPLAQAQVVASGLFPFAVLDPAGVQVAVWDESARWVRLSPIAAPELGQALVRPNGRGATDKLLDVRFAADGLHLVVVTGPDIDQPAKVAATWYVRTEKLEEVATFPDLDSGAGWARRPSQSSARWAAVQRTGGGVRLVWTGEEGALRVALPDPAHPAEKVLPALLPGVSGESTTRGPVLRPVPAGERFSLVTFHPGPGGRDFAAVRLIEPQALQQRGLATRDGWKPLAARWHYPSDDGRYVASLLDTPSVNTFPLAVSKLDGPTLTPVPLGGLAGVEVTRCLGFRPKQLQLFVTRLGPLSTMERWDVTPAGLVAGPKYECDPGEAVELPFALTASRVLLATQKAVYEWDADTGRRIHREPMASTLGLKPVRGGRFLATLNSVSPDGPPELTIWDTNDWTKMCRRVLPGVLPASAYAIHPSGRRLVSSELGTRLTFWDIGPWGETVPIQEVVSLEVPKPVTQLAFSADGLTLAGVSDGGVHLWQAPGTPNQ